MVSLIKDYKRSILINWYKIKEGDKLGRKSTEVHTCTMRLSKKCTSKDGILPINSFYSTNSKFYVNGKFNICKECMKEYCYVDGELDTDKFKNILRIFDVPFLDKVLETSEIDKKETIGVYMKNIYLNYKNSTWLESDGLGDKGSITISDIEEFKITPEILRRWGRCGWDLEDYKFLEEEYYQWISRNKCETMSQEKLFQMICTKTLEIIKARKAGQPTDKLEKSLREILDESKLTPKSGTNTDDNEKVLGEKIKIIETVRPAEFYKNKELYKDFDGIGDYFNHYVLRPMKNLLLGNRDFTGEFSIENEGDNND